MLVFRWLAAIVLAFFAGKLVSKLRLPSILGWLIAGMILGPYALQLMPSEMMKSAWYESVIRFLECAVGMMIGSELVWNRMKKYGKALMITTLTQSLGTFVLVSAIFGIIFLFSGMPVYLAFVFAGIALATAPAPALSIVREFKTDGPVTKTLIPMAVLDDMVGVIIFFTTIAIVAKSISDTPIPIWIIPVMILFPLVIGFVTGLPAGLLLKRDRSKMMTLGILIGMIFATAALGFLCNNLMPSPVLNFMLMGMAFSATLSNIVPEERLEQIMRDFNPLLGVSLMVVILNLGAPLDYHAMLGAGLFTVIYIISRACGKYFGARLGAKAMKMPVTVQKYLGFTLLPHSGVSLVFTGIAVSVLMVTAPESAKLVQGTIAAAAIVNEIIAVIFAKKGFEWAGEFHRKEQENG